VTVLDESFQCLMLFSLAPGQIGNSPNLPLY
jgi:hypothetical protein